MTAPTRAKNVWIKLYTCTKETFTGVTTTTQAVAGTPLLLTTADASNYKYHRVYRNGAALGFTTVVTKTYGTWSASVAADVVDIIYPDTLKTDLRIQQSIEYATDAKTDDWEELNSTVVTTEMISRKGSGTLKLLRNDKTELALIEGYIQTAQLCMLVVQDAKSDLTKAERTVLLEVQFTGSKGSVSVGGKQEETFSFTFKSPINTLAIA